MYKIYDIYFERKKMKYNEKKLRKQECVGQGQNWWLRSQGNSHLQWAKVNGHMYLIGNGSNNTLNLSSTYISNSIYNMH